MRFSVNGRQPYSVIKNADEIKFDYNDRDKIFDLIDNYSHKTIILDVPGQESDWATWQMYNEKFAEFHIALHDLSRCTEFAAAGIRWYWPYPITSYYELDMIVDLGPSYIVLGPPLSFDLDHVVNHQYRTDDATPIPLRMTVNCAHPRYLPSIGMHGVCGQWVRPEDCQLYSTRIQCFDFENVSLDQEATLLKVYKDNKEWPGNLNLLIQRLNWNVDNRAIPKEVGERRMTCGQRCWESGTCHLCINTFMFAGELRKEAAARRQKDTLDNK